MDGYYAKHVVINCFTDEQLLQSIYDLLVSDGDPFRNFEIDATEVETLVVWDSDVRKLMSLRTEYR